MDKQQNYPRVSVSYYFLTYRATRWGIFPIIHSYCGIDYKTTYLFLIYIGTGSWLVIGLDKKIRQATTLVYQSPDTKQMWQHCRVRTAHFSQYLHLSVLDTGLIDLPPQRPLRTEIYLEKYIKQSTVFVQEPFEHYHSSNHPSFPQREALNAVATAMPLAAFGSAATDVVSRKNWWHTVTHGRGSEGETDEWNG